MCAMVRIGADGGGVAVIVPPARPPRAAFAGWCTLRAMSDQIATPTTPTTPAARLSRRSAFSLVVAYPVAMTRALASPRVRPIVALLVGMLAFGTVFFHHVEGWSWLDSLYFCVITLATVGYGDFSPKTDLGKIVTMLYILAGIGLLVAVVNAATAVSFDHLQARRDELLGTSSADHDRNRHAG